ncbi:hypothetical protein A2G24_01065 [Listeria monocytogenes]|uniref:Uncharacterized protein n=1 Tax=Listeria monocytogenes TaxID=1639 RepID=A0A823DFT7_LISMN|nr:hypothetical protein [Listeria monocytogenes]EAD1012217.1 hypothetical protein [Listeria monocytogenes]EAD1186124.1 hypothetical protein [Listeria monocytogenes]EAF8898042.1 hypothetical protein [Listeria monocytogenes]EDN8811037.1 hypothetical protein [Listeria monocytogenes]
MEGEYVKLSLKNYEELKAKADDMYKQSAIEFLDKFSNFSTKSPKNNGEYFTAHVSKKRLKEFIEHVTGVDLDIEFY